MYLKRFSKHIEQFMDRAGLWPASGRGLVAVSGGVDSMALLTILKRLQSKKNLELRVIHINHGTRQAAVSEAQLVADYCDELGLEFINENLQLSLGQSNFEALAREQRYEVFKRYLSAGDLLYTAHHLDDSFEWSLMQQFKSSSSKSCLGVPVLRDFVARPFLCVSKKQIEKLVKMEGVPYAYDQSNDDIYFERNYLRKEVIPQIAKKYPAYLKHYAHRSNEQAVKMGLSRLGELKKWKTHRDQLGGVAFIHPQFERNFEGAEEEIIKVIASLSEAKRGVLREQVCKMVAAVKVGKMGPMQFSGGVIGYMGQGILYFVGPGQSGQFQELDKKLLKCLQQRPTESKDILNFSTLQNLSYAGKYAFPNVVFSEEGNQSNLPKPLRRPHPLLPRATAFALNQNLWFHSAFQVLSHWKKTGAQGQVSLFLP